MKCRELQAERVCRFLEIHFLAGQRNKLCLEPDLDRRSKPSGRTGAGCQTHIGGLPRHVRVPTGLECEAVEPDNGGHQPASHELIQRRVVGEPVLIVKRGRADTRPEGENTSEHARWQQPFPPFPIFSCTCARPHSLLSLAVRVLFLVCFLMFPAFSSESYITTPKKPHGLGYGISLGRDWVSILATFCFSPLFGPPTATP